MKARTGDLIIVPGRKVGDPQRRGHIIEVRGPDGQPPYLVRWEPDNHEGLLFPSGAVEVHPPD
jgi:hypothetical protein